MACAMEYNVSTENGFLALGSSGDDSEVGYGGYDGCDEGDFELVRRKRKRRDTGGAQAYVKHFDNASIENKLSLIFEDLQILKFGQRDINRGMSNFKSSMAATCKKVDEVISVANSSVGILKLLSYKSIDIEARSRRNNLIIRGVEEVFDENCFHTVRRFICERLDLDANEMFLVRAHRLGARRRGIRPFETQKRPLIVAFRDYTDIVDILANTKHLKGTQFSVDRDYPREIYEARKRLWPLFKEKRKANPRADVYIQYPAKLMVNKTVIKDEFPDWFTVLNGKPEVNICKIQPFQNQLLTNSITNPVLPSQQMNQRFSNSVRYDDQVNSFMNERTFRSSGEKSRDVNVSPQREQMYSSATRERISSSAPVTQSTDHQSCPQTEQAAIVSTSTVSTSTSTSVVNSSEPVICTSGEGHSSEPECRSSVNKPNSVSVVSGCTQGNQDQSVPCNLKTYGSSLSPYANSFKPAQIRELSDGSLPFSDKHKRSVSVPRHVNNCLGTFSLSGNLSREQGPGRVGSSDNAETNMPSCSQSVPLAAQTKNFKLPPPIDQSIYRSSAPVNVPSASRSNSQHRESCDCITTPVNDNSKGGHVSRSRSVTKKTSPIRRKVSNSKTRNKGQGSGEQDKPDSKQTKAKSGSTGSANC